MAFKMKSPYPKRTKTFTTDASGGVQKTVTRTSRKGDIKSKKVVDYDASGTRTRKTHTLGEQAGDFAGTRTVEGKGLDAIVTNRRGQTGTRRENIKRDVKNVAKGAVTIAGMTGGMIGGMVAGNPGAAKTAVGIIPRVWGGGIVGTLAGTDIANKLQGGGPTGGDLPEGSDYTRRLLTHVGGKVKEGVQNLKQKVKNVPSNIKKKVHAKRKSKANK